MPTSGVVTVLGDEPAAVAIDDDPGQQRRRRVAGRRDERLIHVQRLPAGG